MGKADRRRAQNARERVAAQQAAARRAEARRRMLIAGGSVVVVIAVVVGLVLAKALSKPPAAAPGKTAAASATSNSAVVSEITSVPASVLDSVGAGPAAGSSQVSALVPVSGSPLTSGGKPEMLYVGAEYCPFCAAERWAMAVALSRFGTFANLHFIRSESSDVYSNTATLTFYQSSYTSKYLVFTPVETTTTTGAALQSPTTAQLALMNAYDAPPYVPSADKGSFPFMDIGNKYISDGAQFLPTVLGSTENPDPSHFGLSWAQIGKDLQDPNNPVAQAILGSANHITAAICKLTHGQPGSVCSSAAVTSVGSRI